MANRRFIDFPIASTVNDNDIVLIWQDGLNKQTTKGTLIQGAPTSLEGLTDVDIAGLINGQILQYNSTTGKWENVDRTDINLSELGDVSIVSPSNGQVLVYNSSTSKWENSSGGYVPYTGAVTTVDLGAQTIQAGSFVKVGGTSAQFLKADGSIDSSTYLTTGSAAATYVPYTGATADVNLGTHDLTAERGTFENNGSSDTLTVNHTSGSGYGIIVTKGGNNEALYVSKTSGSGNAMTVVGGRTSLVDLALSSVTNTAGDFLTIIGGVVHKRTAAEVRTDIGAGTGNGTVTSVGLSSATSGVTIGSTPVTTSGTITIAIATASGSQNGLLSSTDWTTFNNKQNALTNPVTGTGTTNYLPKFTGTSTIGNSNIQDSGTLVSVGVAATFSTSASINTTNAFGKFQTKVATDANFYLTNYFAGEVAVQFTNDANSLQCKAQFYASQFAFTTGNLLVNTTTDAGFKLDVNGTGRFSGSITGSSNSNTFGNASLSGRAVIIQAGSANQAIMFKNSAGGDATLFINGTSTTVDYNFNTYSVGNALVIKNNGNIGINTATPSNKLDIQSANGTTYGATPQLRIGGGGVNNSYAQILFSDNALSDGKISYFPAAAEANRFFSISARQTESDFVIRGNGNCGIGTTSPVWLLEVNKDTTSGSTGQYPAISVNNPNANGYGALYFYQGTTQKAGLEYFNGNNSLTIYSNSAPRLTITSGGNVLIGTTTDVGAKLYVNGAIRTSAPSGGSAVDWKLGNAVSSGALSITHYIKVEVNGVVYYLQAHDPNTPL